MDAVSRATLTLPAHQDLGETETEPGRQPPGTALQKLCHPLLPEPHGPLLLRVPLLVMLPSSAPKYISTPTPPHSPAHPPDHVSDFSICWNPASPDFASFKTWVMFRLSLETVNHSSMVPILLLTPEPPGFPTAPHPTQGARHFQGELRLPEGRAV